MAIEPGTRFGSYEVAEAIGAGGMGEVYRATDTTLARDVALKVLPASFAEDADRVTRFEREAKTLASLNHPNIAQIYGLEKSDGTTALVMELVDGATLEERIAKGPIPADEALGIAMQIADALEAAHGQNIVHRDLKPANIKLKADGTVKVLDFGIAKALAPESLTSEPQSPIMTTPATQVGVILGTAAYMSPEQAKGKAIDQRTDIWAFGCVLYEMLTGQLAFGAEDVPTTLARIIANDTNLESLPGAISPAVRHTIKLCLQKDVRERVADIRDVKLALAGSFEAELPPGIQSAQALQSPRRLALPVAASVALTAVAAGVAAWILWPAPAPLPVSRFEHLLPEGEVFWRAGRSVLTVSPDGRTLVYNAVGGLYLRNLDELEANLIPGTDTDLDNPFFSPDGQSVAYWDARNELRRIAVSGGAPVTITDGVLNPYGASWSEDETIVYGQPAGIYRVSAIGGEPELIVESGGDHLYGPQLLPGGDAVLFTLTQNSNAWDTGRIVVQSLTTGDRTVLVEGASDGRYLPSGHLIYARADTLFAETLDLETMTASRAAVPVVQETMRANAGQTPVAHFDVSDNGTLVYAYGLLGGIGRTLVWVDRAGRGVPLGVPAGGYAYPRISPDGRRIALDDVSADNAIWVWDTQTETRTRLTVTDFGARNPVWTPDGQRIAYVPMRGEDQDIDWKAANNTGQPEVLVAEAVDAAGTIPYLHFFSPSETELIITANESPTNNRNTLDIGMVTIGSTSETTWLLNGPYDESTAALSPDGHWIAYESTESGQNEIYVRPFPNVDDDFYLISNGGGFKPLWAPDGGELFYLGPTEQDLWSVTVETSETAFSFSNRARLMDWPYIAGGFVGHTYDISPIDGRFLAIADETGTVRSRIVIVENWFEELERLVPTE